VEEYEDIELDDDDDGVDENDDEFNDIQESGTVMLEGEPVVEEPPGLVVGGAASLRASLETLDPLQRAKKTFRVEKPLDSQEMEAKTKKRSFDATATQNGTESVKRPRLATEGPKESSKEKDQEAMLFAKVAPRCLCSEAPLLEQGGEVCGAVEVVGGHRVGCRNKVVRRGLIRTCRQLTSLPVVMCELHRRRFTNHAACPLCGEFCTHGLVYMCRPGRAEQPHLFHRGCYNQKPKDERACPHCGTRRTPLAVQLKMGLGQTQLKFLHFTSKMTMPTKPAGMNKEELPRWDSGKKRERQVQYKLPNGKILSADILPDGLEAEKLEEVIKGFENKSTAKCTTRNMYVPTSAGDNVKLLQLLALDYSPSQKFPEADGGTPLHVAAGGNHTLTAHILVQAGAEINAFDDNNETPLMIAAYNGYPAMTRYLITTGAKLELKSDDGMTALHLATQNGHLECAHIILGSNKLPRNHINVKDDGGWTPLVWACEHKHEPVIRFLLEQGCDLFSTDVEMNVAMHWAAFSGSKSIVELLLAAGSHVNVTNGIGETPLHIALRQDHYECALLLVTRGARLDIQNQQGQLPAQCLSEDAPNKATSLLQLGTTLQKLMSERKQKFLTEKTVCQDISNAKETIPVTAVNGEDLEQGPTGYV
jgi:euchromatic histone-lysine N-methyltransferase